VQHGKTSISNLSSLYWRATVVDWSDNVNANACDEQNDNAEGYQKKFADALHGDGQVA
jgi:hypothetical protein